MAKPKPNIFASKLYEVEHALVMYAYSFAHLPAFGIYEEDILAQFGEVLGNFHIYLIGYLPVVTLIRARQVQGSLVTSVSMLGKVHDIEWPLPKGWQVHEENHLLYVSDQEGNRYGPDEAAMITRLRDAARGVNFDVQYIGQAYGREGERNAIDRLRRHETLQQISLKGVPEGHRLELLLLEIAPANMLVTMLNPHAMKKEAGNQRIKAGLDKLFGTNEKERVALYEASLIRYFQPKFNKEFKDSFPSTNMKLLSDCYDKDFSMVVAEINFDSMPYAMGSDGVAPAPTHIASFDLHKEADRKVFFSTP